MSNCQYCNSSFKNNSCLNYHQKNAKYCLNLRKDDLSYKCEYCNKVISTKYKLETHKNICKEREKYNIEKSYNDNINLKQNEIDILNCKLNDVVSELETVRRELENVKQNNINLQILLENNKGEKQMLEKYFESDQDTIKAIASKTTVTNTNKNKITINNRLDLSYERLAPFAENYTMEHFKRGSAGIADWAGENFLLDDNKEPLYVCSDKARKNFIYIDEKGNRIRDEHAETLRNQIKPVLEHKMKECNRVNYAWLAENDDDNNEFTEKMFKLHKDNREIGPDFDKRLIELTKRN